MVVRAAQTTITAHVVTGHTDWIHDIAYDFFGTRLATCSSDLRIRIFQRSEDAAAAEDDLVVAGGGGVLPHSVTGSRGADDDQVGGGGWELIADWQAHDGPVLRVAWAHPEFGSVRKLAPFVSFRVCRIALSLSLCLAMSLVSSLSPISHLSSRLCTSCLFLSLSYGIHTYIRACMIYTFP